MAQQIKDRCAVPEGDRKVTQTAKAGREGVGGEGGGGNAKMLSNRTANPKGLHGGRSPYPTTELPGLVRSSVDSNLKWMSSPLCQCDVRQLPAKI